MNALDAARRRFAIAAGKFMEHVARCRSAGNCTHQATRDYYAAREQLGQLETEAWHALKIRAAIPQAPVVLVVPPGESNDDLAQFRLL